MRKADNITLINYVKRDITTLSPLPERFSPAGPYTFGTHT